MNSQTSFGGFNKRPLSKKFQLSGVLFPESDVGKKDWYGYLSFPLEMLDGLAEAISKAPRMTDRNGAELVRFKVAGWNHESGGRKRIGFVVDDL